MKKHAASVDKFSHVYSLARSSLTVAVCLTELIDNSFDAGARRVSVEVAQGKHLRVTDDGDGIEDLSALVHFGLHVPHKGRGAGSGLYGVGFKEAIIRLGGECSKVIIDCVRDGENRRGTIEWSELKSTDDCMEESDATPAPSEPSGTDIKVQPLKMRFPEGKDRETLAEQLGYIYAPALKEHRVVTIRAGGATLDLAKYRWRLPALSEHIDELIEIGGKQARLYAGIVADGEDNSRPGLSYQHGWRVVKAASREGCGTHGTQKICGFVTIIKGWDRTKNKDDLVDAEDLYEEIERRMGPLLDKADRASHHIELSGAIHALESALSSALSPPDRKATRRRTNEKPGTVVPTNAGPKPAQAESTRPGGKIRQKGAGGQIKLELCNGWHDGMPLGKFERTTKVTAISLYKDHPWIARATSPWDADKLFAAAMVVMNLGSTTQGEMLNSIQVSVAIARHLGTAAARLDGAKVGASASEERPRSSRGSNGTPPEARPS